MTPVDVLVPTYRRPAALAVTLTGLMAQTYPAFRVVVSDQTEHRASTEEPVVRAAVRLLEHRGHSVVLHRHLPRRGLAEHRQFLLEQAEAPYALFLDDDVVLEPETLTRLVAALVEQGCGFVACAVVGLSFRDDVREHEQDVELWEGRVEPEDVRPGTPAWKRWRLHNAANLVHVAQRLGLTTQDRVLYKVAWAGGCVLYDTAKLRACGGFGFWRALPAHCVGEDVVAQQRVMERYGGCGLLPSGAYHQELETTVPDRRVDAPSVLRRASATAGGVP